MEYVVLVHGCAVAFCHDEEQAERIADIHRKNTKDVEVFKNFDINGRILY